MNEHESNSTLRHELIAVIAGLEAFRRKVYEEGSKPVESEHLFALSVRKLRKIYDLLVCQSGVHYDQS